jgi:hypothetical protein
VRKNGRANRVQPFVAIGMVKVPMRVDEVLDGLGTNPGERVSNLWASTGKAGIDQQLTVSTGQNRDVPTGPQQNAYIAAELLDRDFIGCGCLSCRLYQSVLLSEKLARSQPSHRGGRASGCKKVAARNAYG